VKYTRLLRFDAVYCWGKIPTLRWTLPPSSDLI